MNKDKIINEEYDNLLNTIEDAKEKIAEVRDSKGEELTDEEINDIVSVLHENVGERTKKLREIMNDSEECNIPYACLNQDNYEKSVASIEYDTLSGESKVIDSNPKKSNNVTVSDMLDDNVELKLVEASEESMKSVMEDMGVKDLDEINLFIKVLKKHRNKEKVDYMELPKLAREMVDSLHRGDKTMTKPKAIKITLDYMLKEVDFEQEFVDFQEALKKEMNIPGLMDMYSEFLRESMEIKLLDTADKIESEDKDKAESLRAISREFTETYKFTRMLDEINNNTKNFRRLDKDISKYSQFCRNFNYKYMNNKLVINDINLVYDVLHKVTDYSDDTIKKFIILFAKICMNYIPDNIINHTYMYYTIKNILSLSFIDEDTDFTLELKDNLYNVLDKLS